MILEWSCVVGQIPFWDFVHPGLDLVVVGSTTVRFGGGLVRLVLG